MPLLKDSMTEKEEEEPGGSLWQVIFAVILFEVISLTLESWLRKSVAVGTAALAVALIIYPLTPRPRVGFLKWLLGSLMMIMGFVGLIYGLSRPLCRQFGAVLTSGLLIFVMFMSLPFVLSKFLGQKVKEEPWKWLAFSAGWGLLFAFLAYINPQGFCKP